MPSNSEFFSIKSIKIVMIGVFTTAVHFSIGFADELVAKKEQLIKDFVKDVCYDVSQEGSADGFKLSGEASAKLNSFVAKLGELGINGVGEYNKEEWKGVLQKDLAATLQKSIDCRRDVSLLLIERIFQRTESEIIGTLEPGNEPTPHNACDDAGTVGPTGRPGEAGVPSASKHPPFTLMMLFGDDNVVGRVATDPKQFDALQIGRCSVLSFKQDEKGISFNSDLFDQEGHLIARVDNGSMRILTGEKLTVDREGDLSRVIIRNDKHEELLNIHYLNPTTLQVQGIFACHGHPAVRIKKGEPIYGAVTAHNCFYSIGPGGAAMMIP